MKKKSLFVAGALFTVGALAMLTGCGGKTGEISGKYKEATAEEVAAACEEVRFDDSFGNVEEVGWTYNLQAEEEASAKIDLSVKADMGNGIVSNVAFKWDAESSAEYLVSLAMEENGLTSAGAGKQKLKTEGGITTSGITFNMDYDEELAIYHDMESLYISPVKTSSFFAGNTKLNLEDVVEDTIGGIGGVPGMPEIPSDPQFPAVPEKPDEFKAMLEELTANGVKISMDQRKGLKLKFTLDKQTAEKLIAEAEGEEGIAAEIAFNSFAVDFYVAFDKDGMFEGTGIVYDVDMSLQTVTEMGAVSGTVVLKGGCSLKATDKQARLPEGIATDDSYKPFDAEEMLKKIFGFGAGAPAPDWN